MSTDAKIVVVGASIVALSFLENLVFNPVNHCNSFENIILISDRDVPYQVKLTDLEDCMVPKVAHYNYEYMKSIGLFTFVNVITGTVTAINRFDKFIMVNGKYINYDYLFLFIGEQLAYCVKENEIKFDSITKSYSLKNDIDKIENLFLLNSEHDVIYVHNYIKTMKNDDKIIVVYGQYLGLLSVINVLLESNIDGSRIVFVRSNDKENFSIIRNEFIEKAVHDELQKQGVRVLKNFKFETLRLNDNRTKIVEVTFKSDSQELEINCAGLFWFDQKRVSDINRLTIIRSMLRFDGHLIVNSSFETNIKDVYAAGPVARFVKNNSLHVCYNSVEIGARVANRLMELLNIVVDGKKNAKFVQPLTIYCRLPGKYNYLHATVPGFRGMKMDNTWKVLKTRNADNEYFEIVVNSEGNVLELSCYSKRDFKYTNLIHVCGKNLELFNDFEYRLKTNSIQCFFEYFEEPWAYPMYSDRFETLLDNMTHNILKRNKEKKLAGLLKSSDIGRHFYQVYGQKLRDVLAEFLAENVDDFPTYVHDTIYSKRLIRKKTM